jgi:hypothetical protein
MHASAAIGYGFTPIASVVRNCWAELAAGAAEAGAR